MEVEFCDIHISKGKAVQATLLIKYAPGQKIHFCKECTKEANRMARGNPSIILDMQIDNMSSKMDEIFGERIY